MASFGHDGARLSLAVNDFRAARRKAVLESILSFLSGRSADLISYDEIRNKFRTIETARRTLENIPISQIAGSVGRYADFSRSFLPRRESDQDRWASVRVGIESQHGLPPIETYKVGEVYFILDGHHRVSVAREMGFETIEGYVIPVSTRVPLSPGDSPDDLIIKAEYDEFLGKTKLDDLRPGVNLLVSAPGQYPKLLEHIAVNKYFMDLKQSKETVYADAVTDWYDTIYLPIATMILDRNILRDFPGRTEADLYLWIIDHRSALGGGELGWEIRPDLAADDFTKRYSPTRQRIIPRILNRVTDLLVPDVLEGGPPPGYWREHQSPHRQDRLFDDILIALPGVLPDTKNQWSAIDAAIEVAKRESARLTGMHVIADRHPAKKALLDEIEAEFNRRCEQAGITHRMVIEQGSVARLVCERSRWVDLTVFGVNYPPPSQPWKRLRSGSRYIIRCSSSPIFAVQNAQVRLDSALLAYGPGPKADEALFVAAYLAAGWKINLTVITVTGVQPAASISLQQRARAYLENQSVQASYIEIPESAIIGRNVDRKTNAAREILLHAESSSADFIIMGGYESSPIAEAFSSSIVDRVLRSTRRPVLLCR